MKKKLDQWYSLSFAEKSIKQNTFFKLEFIYVCRELNTFSAQFTKIKSRTAKNQN